MPAKSTTAPIGTIYRENHIRRHHKDGSPEIYRIWTAEVVIRGKTYRKKSKNRAVCYDWLDRVYMYTKGKGEFPARLTHPGEDPLRERPES